MADTASYRPTDNAFLGPLKGGSYEAAFTGALSFMRRRYSRDLAGIDAVVWGVPFDSAVTNRPGARFGPQAIRRASAILCGDPQYPFAFDPFETLAVIDWGDASFDQGYPMEAAAQIKAQADAILASGAFLLTLGGDHYVTWPLLQAHVEKHGPVALVQFDAHQDTWDDDGGRIDHGSFVARAVKAGLIDAEHSIQVGIRTHAPDTCGIEIVYAHEVETLGVAGLVECITSRVGSAKTYVTFDIDCLDPAFAPGTGTPVSGGLTSREALMTLRALGGLDIVGADIVEVAPAYDHADITAIAGSTVALYYLGLLAEKRGAGRD